MRIRYFCFWNALTGFGRAARDYVAALVGAGHEVEIIDWTSIPGSAAPPALSPERPYAAYDELVRPWPARVDDGWVAIYHAQPRLLAALVEQAKLPQGHDGAPTVALTTWETSRIPDAYALGLDSYDLTVVPSRFCEEVLRRSGQFTDRQIEVVPHTFRSTYWLPQASSRTRLESLRFYAMGAWSERKNHHAILRAYLHAFTPYDDVTLQIWSPGADLTVVKSLLGRSGLRPDEIPELVVDPQPYGSGMEPHDLGDVFVSASRAEGWGLPCFEAAVLGKTIISPVYSGEREYLDGYTGLRSVQHTHTPCFAGPGRPIAKGDKIVGELADAVPGMSCREHWAEPDIGHIAERMRSCYEQHKAGNHFTGASSRAELEARFGYDVVARHLVEAIEDHPIIEEKLP